MSDERGPKEVVYDERISPLMTKIADKSNPVRHEDGKDSGTWIDASVFVPDLDAVEENP